MLFFIIPNVVSACVFIDKIEFYHPLDVDQLEKNVDTRFIKVNKTLIINYDEYSLHIDENGFVIKCKDPMFNCVNNKTYKKILERLEDWKAYDLSKEDKEDVSYLVGMNVVLRKLSNTELLKIKMRSVISKFFGNIFCISYEKIIQCKNSWCSLRIERSSKCKYSLQKC